MKHYLYYGEESQVVEIKLHDDPLTAVNEALSLIDELSGNSLSYPSVLTEEEHKELQGEDDA